MSKAAPESRAPNGKPNLDLAWLSLSIPLIVSVVALGGDLLGDGRFTCLAVLACGAGCVMAFVALIANRSCANSTFSVLALILNLAVGLGAVFIYATAHFWDGVKG
jgi:hypothetical protein